jgi:hypothetical protein
VEKIGVTQVSSPSHPIQIDLSEENCYRITFTQRKSQLDRDIILDIELSPHLLNPIVVEPGAVMASFILNEDDCQRARNNIEIINEFIFLVGCRGSMENENKIGFARQAMLLFLESLPLHCHFNIVRFGYQYETLFNETAAVYNEENANKAKQFIKNIKADLTGADLVNVLSVLTWEWE